MINVSDIHLRFADKVIFEGINLFIKDRDRIGIVGDNGTGKTTFLKTVLGKVYLDKGNIDIPSKLGISYLSQEATELPEITVLEFMRRSAGIAGIEAEMKRIEKDIATAENDSEEDKLMKAYGTVTSEFEVKGGYSFDSEAKRILAGLGFKPDDHSRLCTEFSGGWKIRINLAVVLSKNSDILLLDEPTNHLDSESMEWLESYLKEYQGIIITVSHDRRFLDKMVTKILELRNGNFDLYPGNYSFYLKEKERRAEVLKKEYESQQSEIKRIKDFIERFRYKSSKAPQVQSRIKMLEKFDIIELDQGQKNIRINFPPSTKSGNEVVRVKGLTKYYGDLKVFENAGFTVYRKDRIAVTGKNGAGKSTLFKIMTGEIDPSSGKVEHGLNVIPAYFSQESTDNLDTSNTVWEEAISCGSGEIETKLRTILGAFLFSGNDIFKPVSVLSGGERSRLALFKILLKKSNFLILDEPTNHLDKATKEIFQKALLDYEGTIMIVSHDRFFLDELADKVFEIRNHRLRVFEGNYSYYIEKKEAEKKNIQENSTPRGTATKTSSQIKKQKRTEARKRNELYKLSKPLRSKLKKSEEYIEKLENQKKDIEQQLNSSSDDPEKMVKLSKETGSLEVELAYRFDEWEKIHSELEALEEKYSDGN